MQRQVKVRKQLLPRKRCKVQLLIHKPKRSRHKLAERLLQRRVQAKLRQCQVKLFRAQLQTHKHKQLRGKPA